MSVQPATPIKALSPTRLVDDVVEHLRGYIADNELADGDRLPTERALAEALGTSRATVAQAVRILAVMGLVEIRHGSGVYVRHDTKTMFGTTFDLMVDMAPGSVGQLADFRYFLERSLLEKDGITGVDGVRLQGDFEALTRSKNRLESWIEADADFHVSLVAATGNRYLHATYEMAHRKILSVSYADWIERGAVPSWLRGRSWDIQIALHRDILDAALEGDQLALAGALSAHQTELMSHLARAVDLTP